MEKICQRCGNPLADDMRFCVVCGTPAPGDPPAPQQPVYSSANQTPVYQQPVQQQFAYQQPAQPTYSRPAPAQQSTGNKTPLIICCAIAAVVILAIIIGCVVTSCDFSSGGRSSGDSSGKSSYTDPIDTYIDVMVDGATNKIEDLAPQAYWDYLDEEEGYTIDDITEDFEDEWEDYIDDLEDEYGRNIRMTYDVTNSTNLSSSTLKNIAEALDDTYGIDSKTVKSGKELDVELTVSGSEDSDTDDAQITVIKIGSKWYWINYYEYDDEYRVYFSFPN